MHTVLKETCIREFKDSLPLKTPASMCTGEDDTSKLNAALTGHLMRWEIRSLTLTLELFYVGKAHHSLIFQYQSQIVGEMRTFMLNKVSQQ